MNPNDPQSVPQAVPQYTPVTQVQEPVHQQQNSSQQQSKKIRQTGEYLKILFLRTVGNFIMLTSLFMIAKTFYQPVYEEVKYFANQYFDKVYVIAQDPSSQETEPAAQDPEQPQEEQSVIEEQQEPQEQSGLARLLNIEKVEVLVPENPEFSVVIPKIGANARVVGEVDASDEEAYLEALKDGVAHVKGTAYPGEDGHIFLFAHSTDYVWNVGNYNAVFYLLYKLKNGDEVNLFYGGQRYAYEVTGSEIVDASEVEYVTRQTDEEFLTLQTCWPPGTTLKRLLVFAERKEN